MWSKANIRKLAKEKWGYTPDLYENVRVNVGALIDACEIAAARLSKEREEDSQARISKLPKVLPGTDHRLRCTRKILEDIAKGVYDFVLASPPCNTWSRAVWRDRIGPKPLRSKTYP